MSDLSKFLHAQERTHQRALRELQNGYKSSHWSWWEIPQITGLGMTSTPREYAIRDLSEAKEYLANETLRAHLLELCDALLSLQTSDARRGRMSAEQPQKTPGFLCEAGSGCGGLLQDQRWRVRNS